MDTTNIIMHGHDHMFRGFQYRRNPFNSRPFDAKVYPTKAEAEKDLVKLIQWLGWDESFNKNIKVWDASELMGFYTK